MRKVPELRFDGFDGEWEEKKLNNITSKFDNLRIPMKESLRTKGPYPYHGATGIQDYVDDYIFDGEYILIAEDGAGDINNYPLQRVSGRFWVNNHAHVIQAKDSNNNDFIFYSLSKINFERYLVGGTRMKLNSSSMDGIILLLTSENEQEKIGDLFRKLDDLIEIQEGKVSKMEDFKKSMLQKMFPKKGELVPEFRFDCFDGKWEVNKISDISNQFDRLRKPVKESLRIKGNYPYYGAAGIQDYVDKYIFDGEYVLIAEDGASDILNYPVNYVNEKFRVNNHAHIIQAKEGYQTLFLSYSLKQIDFNPYLVGGTRKKLNAGSLERIKVKTPSIEEQEKIGNFFKNLDTQIESEEKLLDSYKMMKKSLLQKMFV